MDLLNIMINPINIRSTCFLCYKQDKKTTSVHDLIEIHDEYLSLTTSLNNIMNTLFPAHELLLSQACEDCEKLLIKIFSLLQRHFLKRETVNTLIDCINEEMDTKIECEYKSRKCRLKVNIPTFDSAISNSNSIHTILPCGKCNMKFKSKRLLQKHVKITHKNTNEAIICDICGKTFNKSSALKVHLRCHQEKQCPHCFKILKSHSHFNVHVKNHNQPRKKERKIKKHCCASCEYRSINKSTLEAHINKVHLNIRPFICELCEKGFFKKSNLTQHLETHTKVKEKTCEFCGDTFVNEKTLVDHLMLHSGQKPFQCNICNANFITSGRRLEHMKRKHMEKAECCVSCDKKFSLKKDLNSHIKSVHGPKNFILMLDNVQSEYQVIKVTNCKK